MAREYKHKTRVSFSLFNYDRIDYDSANIPPKRVWVFHLSLLILDIEHHDFFYRNPLFEVVNDDENFYIKFFCFKYKRTK